MVVLILPACFLPLPHFNKKLYVFLTGPGLRLVYACITGFGMFYSEPLVAKIIISLSVLVLLTLLAYIASDRFGVVGAFCTIMFIANLFIGLFNNRTVWFNEIELLLNRTIIFSTFAVLSFYLTDNIDAARWFGTDRLNIPETMKKSAIILLTVTGLFVVILSYSSWILSAVEAIFNAVTALIGLLLRFLASLVTLSGQEGAVRNVFGSDELPEFLEEIENTAPPSRLLIIFGMVVTGILMTAAVVLVLYALFLLVRMLVRILMRYIKNRQGNDETQSVVFTEVIEIIKPGRGKRISRRRAGKIRYSSLTERERLIFIYHEYVKKAKKSGYTADHTADTPDEILNEIVLNVEADKFPLPDGLGTAFNAARYGADDMRFNGADELKQRLL